MENDVFKNRVRLRHLDCFVAVAQTHNLGKAAAKLRLTQPAVSKTLNELEEITGARLLDRNRLGARLTRDGETFLVHAVAVLDALNAARVSVGSTQEPQSETVYAGALPTVASDLLPLALAAFNRRHPDTRITVQTATNAVLLQMLKAGEIDFALARMADPEMMAGLSFELLYVEPLVLVARQGHPLLQEGKPSLAEVVRYPLVVSARGTVPRLNTESFFRSRGLKFPHNCLETLSVSLAIRMTRLSDAIWVAPIGAASASIADGFVARLPVSMEGTEEPVGLMHRSEGMLSTSAQAMIACLRDIAVKRRDGSA